MTLRQSRAVVVGGGFSGLIAARALSEFYEKVLVLERDEEPLGPSGRASTPQDQHVHVLLCGGVDALAELFPEIERDLVLAGAVSLSEGLDFAQEMPGYDPFPQRDLGLSTYGATRPLIEQVVRRRVAEITTVEILYGERVHHIESDGGRVTGVLSQGLDGSIRRYEADLIVDASGRAAPTLELISRSGYAPPVQQTAHVGLGYATAIFAMPPSPPSKWKGVRTLPSDKSLPAGLLLPVQGSRWMLTLATSDLNALSADPHEFMALLEKLRTTTISDALVGARPLRPIKKFIFKEASWRRFSDVEHLPSGLLLIA